jgi:hypothetical protein
VELTRQTGSVLARVSLAIGSLRAHALGLALLALLALAGYVRFHGFSDGLVSFNNTRQLHCAIITRGMYFSWTRDAADPRRIIAERSSVARGQLEPPIVPYLVALGYRATGGEHFRVVRLLSASFWLAGGVVLFSLGRLLLSPIAGLIAAAYYLLVPFGVVASQSFQPDPLMILLMLASWQSIVKNDRNPQLSTALCAGLVSGLALYVKPVCGPVIVVLYAALTLRRLGILGIFRRIEPWLVAALVVIPSALYYVGGIASGSRLRSQAAGSFMPEYWSRPEFVSGWRETMLRVVGGPYVVAAALLGLLLAPPGRARTALWALLVGYVAYGFAFPYHIATHDYYHLQLLPILGLAFGALFQRAYASVPRLEKHWVALAAAVCALVLLPLTVRAIQTDVWPRTHGTGERDPRYVEIGELVHHSTRVIYLDPNKYGSELEFDGEVAGWLWPSQSDLRRARRKGRPPLDWRADFEALQSQGAEFFVSVPPAELTHQSKLMSYLDRHHKKIALSPQYVIYDLR